MSTQTQTRAYNVRADSDKPLIVEGLPIVFDQPAQIGDVTEIISPGALDGVDLSNITLQVNHDNQSIPLARSPETMTLAVTAEGLQMSATLPDTERGRELHTAIKRGDLSQMSFMFDIAQSDYNEQTKTRTVTKISKVYELSAVTRAAYPQTKITARNAQKEETTMYNPILQSLEKPVSQTDTHATPEYRTAFYKSLLGQELTDGETRAMSTAKAEKRADAFNTLSTSAAVVPTQTLNEVITQARDINGLYNEIRLFNVPANLSIPIGTPTDAASWHVEGQPTDRKNITTTSVTFSAFELLKILSLSATVRRMELSAFENYLTAELKNSITDAIGAAIVNGTGTGQPQGILSGITWNAQNSLSVATITADNLLQAIAKLPAGYAGGAKFAMSTATLFSNVYPLKDSTGAYLFTDTESGGTHRFFGFPVVLDDNIPAGTILFGNFKYYGANVPQGVAIEVSRESGFTSGLVDFRALCIADAKPILPAAFVKIEVTA
ncbi:MAG: phage major capsid protein [Oscillospiraceae bacterium]|jgi:HK97 family phage major capsid protein|nr:phage major capsid protein [Oscillospiraceae bacterium]